MLIAVKDFHIDGATDVGTHLYTTGGRTEPDGWEVRAGEGQTGREEDERTGREREEGQLEEEEEEGRVVRMDRMKRKRMEEQVNEETRW
jgi:hypothetical protein